MIDKNDKNIKYINHIGYIDNEVNSDTLIIILHGWNSKISRWTEVAERLNKFHIIIPSLAGFEYTKLNKVYNIDDYVKDLESILILQKFKKLIIIGHSHGGRIGLKFAANSEYRSRLSSLILCGTDGIKIPLTIKQNIKKFVLLSVKPLKNILNIKQKIFILKMFRMPAYANSIKTKYLEETFKNIVSIDLTDELNKIDSKKTRIITYWGVDDMQTSILIKNIIKSNIDNVVDITVEGGHNVSFQKSEEFVNKIIKYIK